MAVSLIQKYLTVPNNEETIINEKVMLFSLKHVKGEKTKERMTFLLELSKHVIPEYKICENGSGLYFFKAGGSMIELDISVQHDIDIKPYIHYNPKTIKQDLQKIVDLDYLLFCVLKRYNLIY